MPTVIRGDDWRLYYDTANNWSTPTYVEITQQDDLAYDPRTADAEIRERGKSKGHKQGRKNPVFSWTMFHDDDDPNVETLIASGFTDAVRHLAAANGNISTIGTHYYHMQASITRCTWNPTLEDGATFDMEAERHADSDNDIERLTVSV